MEMGTGKTRTAIELIHRRMVAGKVNIVLWLCPCSVKPTIQSELTKHIDGDLSNFIIAGIESLSSSITLNLELLELVQNNEVYLIVDESNLVKNHKAKRTENILRLAYYCKYKLILNGTPISKCEKDLFSQWQILDWRILGYKSFWSFANNHLEYDENIRGRIRRVLNVDYLVRKISPYTYQVLKKDCLDLPDKSYSTKYYNLDPDQWDCYLDTKNKYLFEVDELRPSTIYRLFTAIQHVISGRKIISPIESRMQTANIFDNPMDNPRIQKLFDIVDATDEKIVIWCKYTHEIKSIATELKKEYGQDSVVEFYGEIKRKQRVANAEKFKKSARFFVANKTCAGYGLNLQFCSYAIYYSNDWDWATRTQSEDRIHRMGQENNVHIIDICANGTLDERILRCLHRKENLVESFKREIRDASIDSLRRWIDNAKDIP